MSKTAKSIGIIVDAGGIDRLEFAITNDGYLVLCIANGANTIRMTMTSHEARKLAESLGAVADALERLL